ncbi:UNVERIFIED_CONTAM: Retrovirus-related Pol polyprotein from transposon TNT 1-94 [Sesamum indicum]
MKHKSEVFEKFEKWKILVENQTGKKLKSLRTDNGLEFCNKDFSSLCDKFGIKRHRTNSYTPQQNGVDERINRTLLDKVRCMLISSGLPKSFWGETIVTVVHLINLSPSVPLSGKTPDFMWTGRKSDISYLRVFGCSAFVHQNLDKLEPRSIKCVFIGYPDGIKGYRLWVRSKSSFKVLISRDVTFNENELPCLDKIQHRENESTFNKVEEHLEDNQEGEENHENLVEQTAENDAIITENPLDDYQLTRDRVRRETRIPTKLRDYHTALITELSEPTNVEEAMKSEKWLSAMREEMSSLKQNETWTLVSRPKNSSIVDCKWIFKIKQENSIKYKARLVAKGFTQKEGIDYNEIFSPVVKYTTICIILALTAHYNWELKQMDVKTAFLHGDLDEHIYMNQPAGFVDKVKTDYVCLLKKSLSIMFLMVCTRPDIAYAISCLSRYMSNPGPPHWEALKWLLKYLYGSENVGILFSKRSENTQLVGYVDSNYGNDQDSRKSTTSYIFTFCGSCISWKSQLQHIVALSTTEVEYIATTEAFKEAIWLDGLIKEISFSNEKLTVYSDSQSSIQLCKNPVFHDRTKHIDVRYVHGELLLAMTKQTDSAKDSMTTSLCWVLVQGGDCWYMCGPGPKLLVGPLSRSTELSAHLEGPHPTQYPTH